ncbi:hypothetical protein JW824_02865 [bacterium]|nr:hypothetical protein [bacterium]
MTNDNSFSIPLNPIEAWIARTKKSQIRLTCAASIGLFLFKLGLKIYHAYLHDVTIGFEISLFFEPVFIAYALCVWFFIFKPLFWKVIQCLKELVPDDAFRHIIENPIRSGYLHRGAWGGMISGVIGMLLYDLPKLSDGYPLEGVIINSVIDFILFAVVGCLLYTVFIGTKLITQCVKHSKIDNIFYSSPFQLIGKWSLMVSMAMIGGIIINLLFQRNAGLESNDQIVHAAMLLVSGAVFFIGIWSAHQAMSENKQREINRVNEALMEFHQKLMGILKKGEWEKAESHFTTASKLDAHKSILEKAKEWPFTFGDIRSLVVSALIPVMITILKKLILL